MNLNLLEHNIHQMRITCLRERCGFIPEQHTLWLTESEWDEATADEEYLSGMNPESQLKLMRSQKFLGVNIIVVKGEFPEPLRP